MENDTEPTPSPWRKGIRNNTYVVRSQFHDEFICQTFAGFWVDRMDQSNVFKFEQQTLTNCHPMAYEYPDLFELEEVPIWYGRMGLLIMWL